MKESDFYEGLTSYSLTVELNKPYDKLHWYIFGDMHIGHEGCDYKGLEIFQKTVLKQARTNKCIVTCMGDAVENCLPTNRHYSTQEHKITLTESLDNLLDFYNSFYKHKNIILGGILLGNHEERLVALGDHPLMRIKDKFGVPLLGPITDLLITLKCGNKKETLRAILAHNIGTRTRVGFRAWKDKQLLQSKVGMNLTKVKIMCTGHFHDLSIDPVTIAIRNPKRKKMYPSTCFLCHTGSFLGCGYDVPSYFTLSGGTPDFSGYIEVIASLEKKHPSDKGVDVFERIACSESEFKVHGEL